MSNVLGIISFVAGGGLGTMGVLQHLKGKRILAAPFLKTGDVAKPGAPAGDKGAVSTEGALEGDSIKSPITGTPCLQYKVEIYRHWEKTVQTQDGAKTEKGKNVCKTLKGGTEFGLNDGSGVVKIDVREGEGDFDNIKKTYDEKSGVASTLVFGDLKVPNPPTDGEGWTTGYSAVETVVPVETSKTLFVLGKLENGKVIKPSWRSLMISNKGREGLMGSTAKKSKVGFIGGGVGAVAGVALTIFGPATPAGMDTSCHSEISGALAHACQANVGSEDSYTWKIEKPGKYSVAVIPAPGKKYPFYPEFEVKQGDKVVTSVVGGVGDTAAQEVELAAGTYELNVRPHDGKVEGGYDYTMMIASKVPGATPAPVAPAVAGGEKKEEAKKIAEDQP